MADDPPYLTVGTEVSAKYKGAFCEAKIRKVVRVVKCKVTFKAGNGSALVADVDIRGQLKVGHQVEAKHPDKNQFLEATVNKIQDSSQYTVVFDDGDITTLRRSALCLKSGRHFNESETLDQLPLTHPEHFSNPVVGGRRGVRRRAADKEESSEEEDEEIPTKSRESRKRVEKELDMGKVVCVESTDKKKSKDTWFPALVVSPSAQETAKIRIKDEYLVRSFRDGRYYTVPKKEITLFTSKDSASKFDSNSNVLRSAVDKAVLYIEKNELPPHWDRDVLFGNARQSESGEGEDQQSESEVSEDDPRNEEKDRFIAQLYKFMDDRSTPLNKVPQVCSRDLDLYDLYKVVDSKGGYTKVTNQSQWKSVTLKLGYGTMPSTSTINLVKQAYKKFLFNFEEFYRKLGCTWTPRTATATTSKSRSSRSIFRERGRPTSSSRESRKGADDDEGPGPGPGPLPSTSKRDREAKEKGSADREKPPASSPEVDSPDTGSESSEVKPKVVPEEKEKTTEEPRKSARGRQPKKDRDAEEVASLSSSSNTSASSRKRRQTASSASRDRDRRESSVASSTKDEGSSAPPTPSSSTTASPSKKSVAGAPPPAAAAATPTAGGRGKYKRSTKGGESEENIEQIVKEEEKPVESKPIPATKTSVGIRLGDKLEVYYPKSEGKTYEAKVIDINEKDGTFLVHYTGWNNRYDEWIDQSRVSENITLKLELSGESETKDISRPPSSTGNMSSSKGQNVKQRKGRNSSSATSSTSASSTTTPSLASGTRSGSSKAAAAAAAASTAASTSIGSKRRRSTSAEVVQVPSVPKRRRTRQKSGQDTSAASTAASDSEGETSDSDGKSIKSEKAPSIIKDIESKTATKEIKDKDVPTNVPVTPPSASDSKQIETKKVEEKEVKSSGHVGRPSKAEKEKKLELADVDDEISSGSAASTKSTSKSKDKDKEPGKMGTSEDTKESSSSSISSGVSGQVIDLDEIRSEMKGLDKMVKSAPGVGPTPQSSASSPAPPTLSAAVGSSPPPPEPTKVDIYEFQDEATDDSAPSITVTAPKLKMFSPVGRSTAAAQDKAPVVVSASAAELVTKLKSQQTQDQEKAPVPIVAIETLDKSLSPSKTTPGEPTIEASTSTTKTPSSSSSHSTPPPLPTKSSKEDTKVISLPVVSVITTPVVPTPATPAATPSKLSTTSSQSHVPVISTPTTAPSLTPPATTVVSLTLLSTPPLPVLASPTPIPSTTSTITSPSMYSSPAPTLVSVNPVIPATSTPVIMTPVSNFKPRTLLGTTSVRVPMPSTAASSVLTPRSIFTTAVTASSTTTPTPTTSVPPPPPVFMPSSVIASTTASATTTSAPRPMLVPVSIPSATLLQSSQTPVVSTHTPPTLLNQQQQRPLLSVSGGGIPRAGVITITSSVASSTNTITGRPSLAPVIAASIAAVGSKVDPKSHQLSTPFGGRKQEIFPHLIQQSTADSSATSSIPTISIVSSKHVSMEGEIQQAQQIHQPPPPLPSSVQQQQQPLKIAAAIPSVPPNQPPPPPVIVKAPVKGPVFGPGPISGTPTDSPKPKKKKAKAAMSSNVPVKTMAPLPSSGAPPPPPVIVPTSTTSTITLTPTPGRKTPVKKRIPPPMESPGKSTKPLGLLSGAPVKQGKMKPEAMNAAIANVGASPTMTIAVPTTVITSTSTIYQTQPSTGMMFASTTSAPPPLPQPPPTPVSITKVGLPVTIKSSAESIAASIAAVASMGSSMSMKSTPPITASSIAPKSNFPMKRFMKDSPSDRMGLNKDKGSFVPHPHSIQQGPPPPPPSTIVIGKSLVPMSESLQQQPPPPSQPPITIQAKFQPVTAHSIAGTQGIPSGPAVTFVKATPTPPGGPGGAHHILDPHPHSTHSHHHQVHSQANLPKHPVIIIPAAPVVIKPTPYQHSQQQQQQQQHATIQPVIVSKPIQIEGSQPPQHSAQQQLQQPPPSVLVSATTQTGTGGVVKQSVLPITVTPSVQLSSVSVLQSSSPSLLSTVPPLPTVSVSATPLHPAIEMKPVTCGEPSITVTKATTVMKSISPDIVAVSNYSSRGSSSSNVFTPVRHDERMSKEPEIVVKPAPASAQIVFHTTTSQQDHSRKVEAGPSLPAITIIPKIDVKEPDENSLLCEEIIPGSPTTGEDAEDKLDDEDKREKEKDSNEKKKPSEEISTPASPPHPPAAISPVSPVLPPSPPLGSGSGNKPVIVLGPKYGEEEEEEDSRFVFVDERKYPRFGDDDDDDKIDDDNSVDSPMGPPSEGREADLQFRDSFSDAGDHSPPSTPSTTSTISTDESLRQRDTSRMSPTPEGGSSKSKDSDDDDMDSDVGSKSTHVDDGDSKHGSTRGSTRIRNQNRQGRSPSPPMGKRRRIMRRNKSPEESSRYTPRTVRTSSGRKVTPVGRDIDSGREREKEVKQTPPPPLVNLAKPPKTGKYNFIPNLTGLNDPDQRITLITQAINDLREQYQKTKNEAASFDRKVKRWKRRTREKERLARQEANRAAS